MSPDELYEVLHRQPFTPVRLHMGNGRTHDLRHPDDAMLFQDSLAVGVYTEGERYPKMRILALVNINEVEPIVASKV